METAESSSDASKTADATGIPDIKVNGVNAERAATYQRISHRRSRTVDSDSEAGNASGTSDEDDDDVPLVVRSSKRVRSAVIRKAVADRGKKRRSVESDSDSSSSSSTLDDSSTSSSSTDSDTSAQHVEVAGKMIPVKRKARAQSKPKSRAASRTSTPAKKISKRAAPRPQRRNKKAQEDSENEGAASSDGDDDETGGYRPVVSSRMAQRDAKQKLVAQLLCRWWYVLDPWPPSDFDCDVELRRRKLKVVPLDQWEAADDVDEEGFTKVYPISYYPGVYRDPQGNAIDLRPLEGKPCYSTFKNYSELELNNLLVTALTNQIAALDSSPYMNTEAPALARLRKDLMLELKKVQDTVERFRRKRSGGTNAADSSSNGVRTPSLISSAPSTESVRS